MSQFCSSLHEGFQWATHFTATGCETVGGLWRGGGLSCPMTVHSLWHWFLIKVLMVILCWSQAFSHFFLVIDINIVFDNMMTRIWLEMTWIVPCFELMTQNVCLFFMLNVLYCSTNGDSVLITGSFSFFFLVIDINIVIDIWWLENDWRWLELFPVCCYRLIFLICGYSWCSPVGHRVYFYFVTFRFVLLLQTTCTLCQHFQVVNSLPVALNMHGLQLNNCQNYCCMEAVF